MLDFLVEQKLLEAVSRGEFDDLPGAGRPLDLDDDPLVPEELRLAYRILKNAGYGRSVMQDEPAGKAAKKLALLPVRLDSFYSEKAVKKLNR
jgi:hypothetical protein